MDRAYSKLEICEEFVGRIAVELDRRRARHARTTEKHFRKLLLDQLDKVEEEAGPSRHRRRR